jgi:uncharacterized protein (TIGR03435 family)
MNRLLLATLTLSASGFAQTFDVATVKKADPPAPGKPVFMGRRGGPGTDDPGRITWSNVNLRTLLTTAYDVKPYQVTGPDWIDSERYDLVAKVPAGATKEQVNVMWQNLLADRFGVALHHSSKVMQAYEMEAVKGGVKLTPTTLDSKAVADQPQGLPAGVGIRTQGPAPGPGGPPPFPGGPQLDKNGIPQFNRPGIFMMMSMGPSGPSARMIGKAQSVEQLAVSLSNQLNKPVVDKTGITGQYDFVLEYTPESRGGVPQGGLPGLGPMPMPAPDPSQPAPSAEPGGVPLVGALQQQLGLKLTATKTAVDMIVIDKAERTPTEN